MATLSKKRGEGWDRVAPSSTGRSPIVVMMVRAISAPLLQRLASPLKDTARPSAYSGGQLILIMPGAAAVHLDESVHRFGAATAGVVAVEVGQDRSRPEGVDDEPEREDVPDDEHRITGPAGVAMNALLAWAPDLVHS